MIFYQKRIRKPAVPIVSLIDILAILLIFFIVTTTFKEKKILLEITVPKSAELESVPAKSARVPLGVSPEGVISLDGEIVELENLPAALENLKKTKPGAQLEVKADQVNSIGHIVTIWDALAKAGFPIKDAPLRLQRPKE